MTETQPDSGADVRPSDRDEDYFTVFGLSRLLNIDLATLEQQFYRLSRKLHPDLFATKPQAEQEWATERSSLLNDAYRTLKEPVARTRYLLKLEGASIEEDSEREVAAARAEGKPREQKVPPDLLAEVFELNMQLEELKMGGDISLRTQLNEQCGHFMKLLHNTDEGLQLAMGKWDAAFNAQSDSQKQTALKTLTSMVHRRNYIRNLVRDVQQALGE
jgi:molecular chaperone HscB